MEIEQTSSQILTTAGANVIFNRVVVPAKCMAYNATTGVVTLAPTSGSGCHARYKVTFSGNVAVNAVTSSNTLVAAVDGTQIDATSMAVTSTASGDIYSVSKTFYILVPIGKSSTLNIEVSGATSTTVSDAILVVDRVA